MPEQIERLLTNMDRNRSSDTYGCFSRPYWHDKVTDFPSAHQQMSVLPLAIVFTTDSEENYFYHNKKVREFIDAGLNYWSDIQNADGSFDEHYPNEHSLGAVAWTLWAITETYLILNNPPNIEHSINKAVEFLKSHDEPGDIANHQAVAASALFNASEITGKGNREASRRIKRLKQMQHNEGWFKEYEGIDIGYHTTTVSHLGKMWKRGHIEERSMIKNSLEFLLNFIDEKNYYSGIIGSRKTRHLHSAGIEALTEDFENARKLAYLIRKNHYQNNILKPALMDDKHFSRSLSDQLQSYKLGGQINKTGNQIESTDFETISIRSLESGKIFINTSKGAVFERYRDGKLIERDHGITIKRQGNTYTSNWPGTARQKNIEEDRIEVEGELRKVPENTLDDGLFIASRIFQHSLGRSSKISLKAKDLLIDKLIRGGGSERKFTRIISFEDELSFEDEFEGRNIDGKNLSNFVPSSEFFRREDLN